MKLNRRQLRKLIAETISDRSLDEGFMDSVKGFFGMGGEEGPTKPQLDEFEVAGEASEIAKMIPLDGPGDRFELEMDFQSLISDAVMKAGRIEHLKHYREKVADLANQSPGYGRQSRLAELFDALEKFVDPNEVDRVRQRYSDMIVNPKNKSGSMFSDEPWMK